MVVLRQQPLGAQVVDVRGPVPQLEGFLALPQLASASGLFLIGQDVVVVGEVFEGAQPSTDIVVRASLIPITRRCSGPSLSKADNRGPAS